MKLTEKQSKAIRCLHDRYGKDCKLEVAPLNKAGTVRIRLSSENRYESTAVYYVTRHGNAKLAW